MACRTPAARARPSAERRGAAVELPQQRAQLVALVQRAQLGHVRLSRCAAPQAAAAAPDRCAGAQGFSTARASRSPARRFSPTLPSISSTCSISHVERAVLIQKLRRGLRADHVDTGDVVGGISDQRQVIDDLLRIDIKFELHAGAIERAVAHGVDERDRLVDELRHVLVARRDEHALARAAARQARVPMTSSASTPRSAAPAGPAPRRICSSGSICERRSSGIARPVRLVRRRTDRRGRSCRAHQTRWQCARGRYSLTNFTSILSTPSSAPVGSPRELESGGKRVKGPVQDRTSRRRGLNRQECSWWMRVWKHRSIANAVTAPACAGVNRAVDGALYGSLRLGASARDGRPRTHAAIAANRFGLGARPGELGARRQRMRGAGSPRSWRAARAARCTGRRCAARLTYCRRRSSCGASGVTRARQAAQSAECRGGHESRAALQADIRRGERPRASRTASTTERPFLERLTYFWTQSLRGLGRQGRGAWARRQLRARGDPAARAGQLHGPAARLDAPSGDAACTSTIRPPSARIRCSRGAPSAARASVASGSMRISRARSSNCRRSGSTAATRRRMSRASPRSSPAGRSARSFGRLPGRRARTVYFSPRDARAGRAERARQALCGRRRGTGRVAVLRDLARRPATAHFIATKLARHFIADEPPPRAVERSARKVFRDSSGDLPTVYRALVGLKESWAQALREIQDAGRVRHLEPARA